MAPELMHMKVLIPKQVFADVSEVSRIVAPGRSGSFGLLPHRMDCVSALKPGILAYAVGTQGETYVAIDDGVLVKTGADVFITVRRAIAGADLGDLGKEVSAHFLALDADQKRAKAGSIRLEAELLKGLNQLAKD